MSAGARWWRRAGLLGAGLLVVSGIAFGPAEPSGAAGATNGCTGSAISFDADGERLDTVSAPGSGGTSSDPFEVDPKGTVRWEATAPAPISGTWKVETKSTPKLSFGGDGDLDDDAGTENLEDHLVVDVPLLGKTRVASGKFYVEVVVSGGRNSCTFSGYVKITGSPLGTPLFWGGVVLGVLGLLLAWAATPTAATAGGAGTSAPPGVEEPPPPAVEEPPPPAVEEPPPPAPAPD